MTQQATKVLEDALQLSEKDRAMVVGRLLESLDDAIDEDAEAAWEEEIRRRVEEIDKGLVRTIPWEEAKQIIEGTRDEPADD